MGVWVGLKNPKNSKPSMEKNIICKRDKDHSFTEQESRLTRHQPPVSSASWPRTPDALPGNPGITSYLIVPLSPETHTLHHKCTHLHFLCNIHCHFVFRITIIALIHILQ